MQNVLPVISMQNEKARSRMVASLTSLASRSRRLADLEGGINDLRGSIESVQSTFGSISIQESIRDVHAGAITVVIPTTCNAS